MGSKGERVCIVVALILTVVVTSVILYPHHVEISSEGEGAVSPHGGMDIRSYQSLDIQIHPEDGYHAELYVDGVLIDKGIVEYSFTASLLDFSTHAIHVVFVKGSIQGDFSLTVEYEGKGSVSPSGTTTHGEGSAVDIIITPFEGNVVDSIDVDGISVIPSNHVEMLMDSDHSINVVFRPVSFEDIPVTVTVTVDVEVMVQTLGYLGDMDFGSVTPTGTVYVVPHGSLHVSVSLNSGFDVKDFTVNGVHAGAVTEYTVSDIVEPVYVGLSIVKKVPGHIIEAFSGTGGSISPYGDVEVADGDDITFTFSADRSYRLSHILVDGVRTYISGNDYTFSDVRSAHTIRAVFTYVGGDVPSESTLMLIEVIEPPNRTVFSVGEEVSMDGMVVRALFSDGTSADIGSDDLSWNPHFFDSIGDKNVTISYTYEGVTRTCMQTVTILDDSVFDVIVTSYHGTMVVDGVVMEFSQVGVSIPLGGFRFDLDNTVPGIFQTVTLEIQSHGFGMDAVMFVEGSTGGPLADQIVLTAAYQDLSVSGTVSELNGSDSGSFLVLGQVSTGDTVTVTLSFPHSGNNNAAMGHTLTFFLGISAMEHTEASA